MDDWAVADLYHLVRQAYPYRDLTPTAFDAVLEMVSGRYRFDLPAEAAARDGDAPPEPQLSAPQRLTALQPRISWDRVHQRLHALPGSQRLALVHGGTIPDTGQYAVYTASGLRIGEVDEEFVYERRIGDTFLLGTNAWRIDRIETDRVIVHAAEGAPALVPFWRGESTGRSYDLGLAQGAFLRELAERLERPDCLDWLKRDYFLDAAAASNLRSFVERQMRRTNCLPTDRTMCLEASRDPLGDWQVILLNPLGRAVNLGLRLALEHRLAERLGYRPQCLHHDDGILIRLTESDEPVIDVFAGITAENVRDMILEELADSALFALRFRQNAARALMMPRGGAGKRAPLWLQRLARPRPAPGRAAVSGFSDHRRDVSRMPARSSRPAALAAVAGRPRGRHRAAWKRGGWRCPRRSPPPCCSRSRWRSCISTTMSRRTRMPAPRRSIRALLDQLIGHDGRPLPLDPRRAATSIAACAALVCRRAPRPRPPNGCASWGTFRTSSWTLRFASSSSTLNRAAWR